MILIWQEGFATGKIDNGVKSQIIRNAPELSFSFSDLFYEPTNEFRTVDGERLSLTLVQINEIKDYIAAFDITRQILAVNSAGKFIGLVTEAEGLTEVAGRPPYEGHWRYNFPTKKYVYINAVDANGTYVGNVMVGDYDVEVPGKPPKPYFIWDKPTGDWKDGRSIEQLKVFLKNAEHISRDAAMAEGVLHANNWFEADEQSIQNLLLVAVALNSGAQLPPAFKWRTKFNAEVPMNKPAVDGLVAAMLEHQTAVHEVTWNAKALIEAETDINVLITKAAAL